uniref:Uncharacterized protein n=1 Tax=Ditylenchus dipsaci TaxID=166011 RepID=A0A915ETY7_9BILA
MQAEFSKRIVDYCLDQGMLNKQQLTECVNSMDRLLTGAETDTAEFKQSLSDLFASSNLATSTNILKNHSNQKTEANKQQEELKERMKRSKSTLHPNEALSQAVVCTIGLLSKHVVFGTEVGTDTGEGRADVIVIGSKACLIIEMKWREMLTLP